MKLKSAFHFLKKRWLTVLIVIGFLTLGYYLFIARNKPQVEELSYTVKRQTVRESLPLSGTVEATGEATLAFQTGGKLIWLGVKEGDRVKKGQAIASLDQRMLRKTLEKELNDYSKERLDFDQTKDNSREVVIGALNSDSRQSLLRTAEQAQFDLNNSVLDVELQTLTIELANIYSPIEGIVTRMGVKSAGVNVLPTQATFQIVNPDSLYFSATADQTDVVKLNESMTGEILFDSFPDSVVPASIQSIGFTPKENESETVYEITLGFDSSPDLSKMRLGMTGDVTFIVKEKDNAIAVPSTYIKTEGKKQFVWTKDSKGKRVKTYVETGEEVDIATEIFSGLEAGDVIYD